MNTMLSRMLTKANTHSGLLRDLRLLHTAKRELLPRHFESQEQYIPLRKLGDAGFTLNIESELALLKSFQAPPFQSLFESLRNSREINTGFNGKDYKSQSLIHNGYYPTPDAEIYAAMISSARPEKIVEVGSGYSTAIARAAVKHIGLNCEIHVIDPEPRRDIANIADRIEYKPVECSSLTDLKLSKNTLLFIDSSHVCRSDGDAPFLYCKLLPTLPAGVLVHIHDIFIPFDYPDNYFERFYTEQYLLHTLLANSTKFEVLLATHYLSREYPEVMQATFGSAVGRDSLFFGASFWMRSRA
jgi:hypothetical protein